MMSKIILHIHTYSEGVIEKDQDGSPHAGATKRPCPDSPLSTSEGGPQQEITTTPLSSTTKKPRLVSAVYTCCIVAL